MRPAFHHELATARVSDLHPRRPGTDGQAAIPPTRPGRPAGFPSAGRGSTGGAGQHQQAEAVSR